MGWKLHCLAPNTIPHPFGGDTAYRKQREKDSNESTRVPISERLRAVAIWGMEFFGPSEIDRLYSALHRLAWRRRFAVQDADVAEWVRKQRSYGYGGSWYNVGLIVRPGDRRFLSESNYAQLPDEVDHAWVEIQQISASLTCVQACFVLRDSAAGEYERELNADRGTRRRRVQGSWAVSTLEPEHLKQEAVARTRHQHKKLAAKWFAQNLPGFFAVRANERFPTAELLTTEEEFLFSETRRTSESGDSFGWRNLMATVSKFDVWTCTNLLALQLSLSVRSSDDVHYTAAVHVPSIPDDHWKHRGPKDVAAIVSICRDQLDGVLRHLAGVEYLKEAESDLKLTRESMNISNLKRQGPLSVVERIQSFFDSSVGLPAVAREVMKMSESTQVFGHFCEPFTAPGFRSDDALRDLTQELGTATNVLSTRLLESEASTREHLEQLSTVISVRESVKAQRRMELLTLLAVVVAAGSFATTVPDKWIDAMETAFVSLVSWLR